MELVHLCILYLLYFNNNNENVMCPIDPVTASAIIGGTTATAGFAMSGFAAKKNRAAQKQQNAANAYLAREMYEKSRRHALEDRDYENFYNSPKQLMARLKEAGINPRLAITGGNSFQSAANTRPASSDTPDQDAPQLDVSGMQQSLMAMGEVMSKYVELSETQAKTDNLRQTRELIETQNEAAKAGIEKTLMETKTGQYSLDYAQRTEQNRTRKALADVVYTEDQNTRQNELQPYILKKLHSELLKIASDIESGKMSRQKTQEEIKNLKEITKGTDLDNQIKAMEVKLRETGVTSHDAAYWRILAKVLNDGIGTGPNFNKQKSSSKGLGGPTR